MARYKLRKIYVEITNVCNLACAFCPATKRKAEFMKLELFSKILHELTPYGNYFYFHVMGEPLLHPELERIFELSAEHKIKANLTSNGTLLKEKTDILLNASALRKVNISLQSYFANRETASGVEGYLDGVFSFIREAERRRPDMLLCLRLWNMNEGFSPESNKVITAYIEKYFGLKNELEKEFISTKNIKFGRNISLTHAEHFEWPDMSMPDSGETRGFCRGMTELIGILADGTVVPCCLDSEATINLGNIKDSPFDEIISSPRAENLRKAFHERRLNEALCRRCGYRRKFSS